MAVFSNLDWWIDGLYLHKNPSLLQHSSSEQTQQITEIMCSCVQWTHASKHAHSETQTHCSNSLICSLGAENGLFSHLSSPSAATHNFVTITFPFAQTHPFIFHFHSHADPASLPLHLYCRVLCCMGVSFPASVCSGENFPWGLQIQRQTGEQSSAVAVRWWSLCKFFMGIEMRDALSNRQCWISQYWGRRKIL